MKINVEDYLRLVENANTIAFWDMEATGLRGDYNSIIVISVKPYNSEVKSFQINQPGNDKRVCREAAEYLSDMDCWVTYYGKGFDAPMLQTRLLKWGLPRLHMKPHIDMYYVLKYHLLTARKSQGHLLSWLEAPEQKMTVGADMWNQIISNFDETIPVMIDRCESDAIGLQCLYEKTKHLIRDIK